MWREEEDGRTCLFWIKKFFNLWFQTERRRRRQAEGATRRKRCVCMKRTATL